jgi:hypothetical protein
MNDLYFACTDCCIYINAGYRWAYWSLEKAGLVKRGQAVSVEDVFLCNEYWNPPKEQNSDLLVNALSIPIPSRFKTASKSNKTDWLYDEVLPSVRDFLIEHQFHRIIFGTSEDFLSFDDESFLNWMQIGYLLDPSPRYFVECLGFTDWQKVCDYLEKQQYQPFWWNLDWQDTHDKARQKFEELVKLSNTS